MFLKKYILPVAAFALLLPAAQAQTDTSFYHLKPVEIRESRLESFSAGSRVTVADSLALKATAEASLTELLRRQAPVYLKTSGAGSLATISFRGTTAEQTALVWNGIQINSPTLGLADLYLVPVAAVQSVKIVHGPGSALYGSGAVGGAIHLDNREPQPEQHGIQLTQQAGSFGKTYTGLGGTYGSKKWQGRSLISLQAARNNFPFRNHFKAETPKERMPNARQQQHAFFQDLYLNLTERLQLSLHGWWQQTERQIPPPLGVPLSKAEQTDDLLRLASVLKYRHRLGATTFRSSYLYDYNRFYDPKNAPFIINSRVSTHTYLAEAEQQLQLGRLSLNLGGNFRQTEADQAAYRQQVTQRQGALFASARMAFTSAFQAVLNLRQEFVTGYNPPITPSAATELRLLPKEALVWKTSVARSFRVPTLNERYWRPGGNPDLVPEQGTSAETGFRTKFEPAAAWTAEAEATVFTSLIQNMIVWRPLPYSTIWGVKNLNEVWARGVELSGMLQHRPGHRRDRLLTLQGSYAFTRSTLEKTAAAEAEALGRQLIYVPQHNAQVTAALQLRWLTLQWHHTFTDLVYTTSDNSTSLPGYTLSGFALSTRNFQHKRCSASLRAAVHNLFNVEYQAVQAVPMPGRNYDVTLYLKLNTITSKTDY